MSQCICENPTLYIGPTAGKVGSEYMGAKVSKTVLIVASNAQGSLLSIGIAPSVYENCIIVRAPNNFFGRRQLIASGDPVTWPQDSGEPFLRNRPDKSLSYAFEPVMRSCTFADEGVGQWDARLTLDEYPSVKLVSVLEYFPNATVDPASGDAPLEAASNLDTTQIYTPYHLGRRIKGVNGDAMDTSYSNDGAGKLFIPQTGSDAIGAEAGVLGEDIALDDFYGELRKPRVDALTRTNYTKGPFEPALEA